MCVIALLGAYSFSRMHVLIQLSSCDRPTNKPVDWLIDWLIEVNFLGFRTNSAYRSVFPVWFTFISAEVRYGEASVNSLGYTSQAEIWHGRVEDTAGLLSQA